MPAGERCHTRRTARLEPHRRTAVSLGAGRGGARLGGQLPQFVPCYVDRLLICCYNYSPTIELIVPLIGRIHSRTPTYRDVNFLCSCQEMFVVIFLLLQKMTNVSQRCYNVNHLSPFQKDAKTFLFDGSFYLKELI